MRPHDVEDLRDRMEDLYKGLADAEALRTALIAMVYIHPCNCGEAIPEGRCARCRAVATLGFDPAIPVVESTFTTILKAFYQP